MADVSSRTRCTCSGGIRVIVRFAMGGCCCRLTVINAGRSARDYLMGSPFRVVNRVDIRCIGRRASHWAVALRRVGNLSTGGVSQPRKREPGDYGCAPVSR